VIDEHLLENLARGIEFEYGPLQILEAYERLCSAVTSGDVEAISNAAREALLVVAEDWRLQRVLKTTSDAWDKSDDALATRTLSEVDNASLLGLEYSVLLKAGLSAAAATSLIISIANEPLVAAIPMAPESMSEQTAALAEELTQERIREEIRNVRFGGLLKRIGRAVHVVGGSVLMLADVGAATAILVANPLAVVPAGGLAVVSLKLGSGLVQKGLQDL